MKTGIDKCLLSACSQQGAAQRPQVCSGALAWSHLLEQKPQLALRLAHPLAEAVGSLPHEERHLPVAVAALVGQRSGDQRLPRPRRTVKQTTSETDGRRCSVKVQRRIMFYLFCLRNAAQSFRRWVININTCLISELYTSVLLLVHDVMKSFVELQPIIIFIVDILSIWISRFVVLSVRKWTDDIFKHISVCVHNQKIFSFLSNYLYKNININIVTSICWWILTFCFLKKWLKPINWLSEQLARHLIAAN